MDNQIGQVVSTTNQIEPSVREASASLQQNAVGTVDAWAPAGDRERAAAAAAELPSLAPGKGNEPPAGEAGRLLSMSYLEYRPTAVEVAKARELVGTGGLQQTDTDDGPTVIDGNGNNAAERTTRQTADGKTVAIDPLAETDGITIQRERTLVQGGLGQQFVSSDHLVFTTGDEDDMVRVANNDDGTLDVEINGQRFQVEMAPEQQLTLRTGDGSDTIEVAEDVQVNLIVDAGHGDNIVTTGAGDATVRTGDGSDTIILGSGTNYVEAGAGDDTVIGGTGFNVIYGGAGNDTLTGGSGGNYISGGTGDNHIRGGAGDDILIGGPGNDRIDVGVPSEVTVRPGDNLWQLARSHDVALGDLIGANPWIADPSLIHPGQAVTVPGDGGGTNRIYAGGGESTVLNAGADDVVHAQDGDEVSGAEGFTVVNVEIDPSLGQSVRIEGSDAFRERIEADLDFLRSSPHGQQMLAELDRAADVNGNTVTIRELENERNGFATESRPGTWGDAQIRNGQAGRGGDTDVVFNPSFFDPDLFPAPTVVLYHELSHAYNAVTGTFQPGNYTGPDAIDRGVPNAERQAVGLESSGAPFDFDRDPGTPPTTTNPFPLTENGIREELNLPPRPSYRF